MWNNHFVWTLQVWNTLEMWSSNMRKSASALSDADQPVSFKFDITQQNLSVIFLVIHSLFRDTFSSVLMFVKNQVYIFRRVSWLSNLWCTSAHVSRSRGSRSAYETTADSSSLPFHVSCEKTMQFFEPYNVQIHIFSSGKHLFVCKSCQVIT